MELKKVETKKENEKERGSGSEVKRVINRGEGEKRRKESRKLKNFTLSRPGAEWTMSWSVD